MKDLKNILDEVAPEINLSESTSFGNFLTEEADFEAVPVITEADDPFGGDDTAGGGDDAGADVDTGDAGADPFGDDLGAAGGDTAGDIGGTDNKDSDGDGEEGALPADEKDDTHEDDPEFTQGIKNNNDVTLYDSPAAKSAFDIEKIMNTVATVIQTLSEDQLVEIEKVKNCIELIFNGKILNEEDLEFDNLKNAIFLIKKIAAKLDTKTKSYLNRKLKEPLIKKRDQIKQDIAAKKGDLNNTRDILTKLDSEQLT